MGPFGGALCAMPASAAERLWTTHIGELSHHCSSSFAILADVNETASQNAEEFGFHPGDIVQEWMWDDDVDDGIRTKIEKLTGGELVDEDYDSAVDGVIMWWRDGDDEDTLADDIVDAYTVLGTDGPFWILTPKPGRPGAANSSTIQSAAKTAGMNAAVPLTVSADWNGVRLRAFGKGADKNRQNS